MQKTKESNSFELTQDVQNEEQTNEHINLFNVDAIMPINQQKQSDIDTYIISQFYNHPTHKNFTRVYKRFYDSVQLYTRKIMGDSERANDMCQETFQRAWEKRESYDPKKSLYITWLYVICRNLCISRLKVDMKNQSIDMDVNDMLDNNLYQDAIDRRDIDTNYFIVDSNNTIRTHSYDDIVQKMFDASMKEIEKMDPLFQQIITMKEMKDMTLAEIAKSMNVTESKVKNIYYKSRNSLSEKIIRNNHELFFEYQSALLDRDDSPESNFYTNCNYKNLNKGSDDSINYFVG